MRRKLLAITVAIFMVCTSSLSAGASQRESSGRVSSSQHSQFEMLIGPKVQERIREARTFQFSTGGGSYVFLGNDFFSRAENQTLTLQTELGTCTTDSYGCWSQSKGAYLPLLIDVKSTSPALTLIRPHTIR